MLDKKTIDDLSIKYQTNKLNIVREYTQNLFLKIFYSKKQSENFLFKGGTALRVIYQSPRFSEDLDFSGKVNGKVYEKIIEEVIYEIKLNGIDVDIVESKKTSGGWLSSFIFKIYDFNFRILNEISYRKKNLNGDLILITNDFFSSYKMFILDPKLIVKEKIEALIERRKSRDIFDFYFILRNQTLRKFFDYKDKERIIEVLKKVNQNDLKNELKNFLPFSYQKILNNLIDKILMEI